MELGNIGLLLGKCQVSGKKQFIYKNYLTHPTIITTNISAGGDSSSLVATLVNNVPAAVGLLFAGSSVATIVNQIENVRWRNAQHS